MEKDALLKPFELPLHLQQEVQDILAGYLEGYLPCLTEHAKNAVKIRHQIQEIYPKVTESLENFSTELTKASYAPSPPYTIYDSGLMLFRQNPIQAIKISYYDKDYPSLDANKGFTVRQHIKPSEYEYLDHVKDHLWTNLEPEEELLLIGIALYQFTPQFIKDLGVNNMQILIQEWQSMRE